MKIFVTGATGMVGRHVVGALRERGDAVVGLSRADPGDTMLRALGAEVLRGDLADTNALSRGVERTDAAVHAAAIVLSRGGWDEFLAANVTPTTTMAQACARAGKRLVHISSVSVYGRTRTYDGGAASVTEDFGMDAPIFPGDHYSRSKREAEQALWRVAQSEGLSAVALRPCVIYGEGDRAFTFRLARMLSRPVAASVGDGRNTLACVYAGNVAAAVLAALDRPTVTGAFNVANDGPLSLREFVDCFAAGLGVHPRIVEVPKTLAWRAASLADALLRALRPGQPMTTLKTAVQWLTAENPYVSSKAERDLGWRPVIQPRDAAQRTGRWFREQRRA